MSCNTTECCSNIRYPYRISRIIKIYFGLSIPSGGNVTEEQFNNYLQKVLLPVFPYITIYTADGTYLNPQGKLIDEKTKVVEIIVSDTSLISNLKNQIKQVIVPYYITFEQNFLPFVIFIKYGNANWDESV